MTELVEYTRQLDIFDPAKHRSAQVSMIGLGGVGSFAALGLAKLGIPKLTIVDFDEVEPQNIPNQLHPTEAIGAGKAESMAATLKSFADIEAVAIDGKFTDDGPPEGWPKAPFGVVVTGLDSMKARNNVWKNGGIKLNPYVPLLLDVRLGGQDIVIYAVNPTNMEDIDEYEDTLHDDGESVSQSCTGRGIIDVGLQVGSLVTRMVRKHYAGEPVPNITMVDQSSMTVAQGEWVK